MAQSATNSQQQSGKPMTRSKDMESLERDYSKLTLPCDAPDAGSSNQSEGDENKNWHANADDWDPTISMHKIAKFLLEGVDWAKKERRCESLHPTKAKCEILPIWITGTRHLVRKVVFEDGTKWVLKLPLLQTLNHEDKAKSNLDWMRLEYETHLCVQSVCTVRVPKIYAMDEGSDTPFPPPYTQYESPCIYMEYLDGLTASDALWLEKLKDRKEPSPEIILSLHDQMARITAQMVSIACPAGGNLGLDPVTGKITVRPDQQLGGRGPYQTSNDFYSALCNDMEENYSWMKPVAKRPVDNVVKTPGLLQKYLAQLDADLALERSFCIVNDDFGFHNILVDKDWNITAIIDLDCVFAAPLSWALKPPSLARMKVYPESEISEHPLQRRNEIQARENYDYWLCELHSALQRQNDVTMACKIEFFLSSGGCELILGLTACNEDDPDGGTAWLEEYRSKYIAADSHKRRSEKRLPKNVE